jgi:peptidase E
MGKIYFLGGEDIAKRDSKAINRKAFIDAGGTPNVLVLPWTATSIDKASKYRRMMMEYFKELGALKVEFAEYSDLFEEIAEKIRGSDLIYLPGGQTEILVERIRNARVDSLLRSYGKVIIGNGAGALALCKDCILIKDRLRLAATVIEGCGLVDFSVAVHYNPAIDAELRKLSKNRKIYAIPEKCALVSDNGNLSFVSNVYLFWNGKKTGCQKLQ